MATDHVNPTQDRIAELLEEAGRDHDPVVMLNLNRYREWAEYPPGHPEATAARVTGREAYLRYAAVALGAIDRVGGMVLWGAGVDAPVIGCDHDGYDEVIAVWYPDRAAFLGLIDVEGYAAATVHRDAALERATLLPCHGEADPVLRSPLPG